jgi:hypothetical protein
MKKKATRAKTKSKAAKKSKARKPAKAKTKKSSSKRSPVKTAGKSKKSVKAKKAEGPAPRSGVIAPVNGVLLGYVEDYFAKIGVIALTLQSPLALGERIQVLGHTTHFEQPVDSMQIDHAAVPLAGAKSSVGIKVASRARSGDHVYRLK